jgi:hypothetical protein
VRFRTAEQSSIQVEVFKGDWHRAVRPAEVERRLRQDRASTIKAILALQIDTSTGVVNDIAAIGQAVKAAQHEALLMIDAVASLGCMPFAMDAWGIDVVRQINVNDCTGQVSVERPSARIIQLSDVVWFVRPSNLPYHPCKFAVKF